jgi:hypothetical protein
VTSGASCTSRPIPWPVGWTNASRTPRRDDRPRRAVDLATAPPTRAAARPAAFAASTTAWTSRAGPPRRPVTDRQGARHVRAVAVDLGATVDGDEVTCGEDVIAGTVVRRGTVRAGRDDRGERDAVRSRARGTPARSGVRASRSVVPGAQPDVLGAREDVTGDGAGATQPRDLGASFVTRSAATSPVVRTSATSPPRAASRRPGLRERDVLGVDPERPAPRSATTSSSRRASSTVRGRGPRCARGSARR